MTVIKLILSMLIALSILLIPLPLSLQWFMPQLCLLVLFSWSYLQPSFVNVGVAWFVGILLDVLTGSLLGLHALSFVLMLYIFLLFHARISMFYRIQQSLIIACFALLNSLVIFCLQSMFSDSPSSMKITFSVFATALLWPIVLSIITRLVKSHRTVGWSRW